MPQAARPSGDLLRETERRRLRALVEADIELANSRPETSRKIRRRADYGAPLDHELE